MTGLKEIRGYVSNISLKCAGAYSLILLNRIADSANWVGFLIVEDV